MSYLNELKQAAKGQGRAAAANLARAERAEQAVRDLTLEVKRLREQLELAQNRLRSLGANPEAP